MNHQKLYRDIMDLDPKIRMVTICGENGSIIFSDHRPGVVNLLSEEESKKSLEMAVRAWNSRKSLFPKIGKGKYVLAEYEKLKRITMPIADIYLVYVTTEIEADHSKIIEGISKLGNSIQ